MKHQSETPLAFLWAVIKPYKHYYLMMATAPVVSGVYPIIYNYAVKLVIDLFTKSNQVTFEEAFWPIFWFVMAQVILDGGWRLHNFAQLKTMPYIFQNMMDRICKHVFYLSHTYFQDNLSGSISGKIKGIGDKYFNIHQALEFKLSKPFLITMFSGVTLAWVNFKIFTFVFGFAIVYSLLAIKFFGKLAKMEQAKQDAWYYLFGTIADRIQNIANIFAFATRKHEITKIQNYYRDIQNPLMVQYYRYDFFISIILSLLYWILVISIFTFVIYLKNIGEVTVGDIAFIISLTFLFAENSWHTTMEFK